MSPFSSTPCVTRLGGLVALVSAIVACGSREPNASSPPPAARPPSSPPAAIATAAAVQTRPASDAPATSAAMAGAPALSASARSSSHGAARPPGAPRFRATTAMRMDGAIVPEKLVVEINRRVGSLATCAALVRETDRVVGSLNLQIASGKEGVTPHLQSPVNPKAERCLIDNIQRWSLVDAGLGRAMVLLVIEEASTSGVSRDGGPADGSSGDPRSCNADADCVLTTFPGCCSCCPCAPLRALRTDAEASERARCAEIDCESCAGAKIRCAPCEDPNKRGVVARCVRGTCEVER